MAQPVVHSLVRIGPENVPTLRKTGHICTKLGLVCVRRHIRLFLLVFSKRLEMIRVVRMRNRVRKTLEQVQICPKLGGFQKDVLDLCPRYFYEILQVL